SSGDDGSEAGSGGSDDPEAAGTGADESEAGSGGADGPAAGGGGSDPEAGSGGADGPAAGSGGSDDPEAGSGGVDAPVVPVCPTGAFCYGFESGVLALDGTLWPSPSSGSGELPTGGQLTTLEHPAGSGNHVLVARPSQDDEYPQAFVGHSRSTAFRTLTVGFDFAITEALVEPRLYVRLMRFIGNAETQTGNVALTLEGRDIRLVVSRADADDEVLRLDEVAAPGVSTRVMLTFDYTQAPCSVSATYGSAPAQRVSMGCDLGDWQVALGLDVVPGQEPYTERYAAYLDNLVLQTD
ncbi:MAG: hypothetical protein ABW321_34725, partial [Polyangiales bacterium]